MTQSALLHTSNAKPKQSYSAGLLLQRKCACGSNASGLTGKCEECGKQRMLGLQRKLAVSEPGDKYEQEADRIADTVMRMPAPAVQRQATGEEEGEELLQTKPLSDQITPLVQRETILEDDDEEEALQTKESGTQAPVVLPGIEASIQALRQGSGQPLDPATRAFMEPRFGHDFGHVRVHTGPNAAAVAQSVNALAFTVGPDVSFAAGQYSPGAAEGRRLLAHELTHTIQQSALMAPSATGLLLQQKSRPDDEKKAEQRAKRREARAERRAKRREARAERRKTKFEGTEPIVIEDVVRNALERARTMADLISTELSFGSFPANLYYKRFGQPSSSPGGFADRFIGTLYPTLEEATREEMQEIGQRFFSISLFLASDIEFLFPNIGETIPIVGCTPAICNQGTLAIACPGRFPRTVVICPNFYNFTTEQQAGFMIHEVGHKMLQLQDFDIPPYAGTFGERITEAECFVSLAADRYGFEPQDPSCPPLP